jgi:transcriptional regulator NrdR family protein
MGKKKQSRKQTRHKERVHCIIKRSTNKCEGYDERKVYASIYAACYVVHMHQKTCEKIAHTVAKKITKLVHKMKEVASKHVAHTIIKELRKCNKDAAFMYETHRDIA